MTEKQTKNKPRFLSLRWRTIRPIFVAVLLAAMVGAFLIARNLSGGLIVSQQNVLLQSVNTVADRTDALYQNHLTEAQRVAFTIGVPEAVRDYRTEALEPILRSLAQINQMDVLIVTDRLGFEVLGLQRVDSAGNSDLAISTQTDLSDDPIVKEILVTAAPVHSTLARTPQGMMLMTGVPIYLGDEFMGVAVVGQSLPSALADVKSSAVADVVFYGPQGDLLQTTFSDANARSALAVSDETYRQALNAVRDIPVSSLDIEGASYQVAYQPFVFGQNTLGVTGVIMPDSVPFVTETGRQLTALLAAGLTGVAVTAAFFAIGRFANRAERVTQVAQALAVGKHVRTNMQPTDEISAAGYALDRYADRTVQREDSLQKMLRRQRRQANHLVGVLESLPDGVIVQDNEGRVILMNDHARDLLGSQRVFRSAGLHELADVVEQQLGRSLAPGLYALGDPHRVHLDEKVLNAQAAAVTTVTQHRIGTVILLRDITKEVEQEQHREALFQRLTKEIQQPLLMMGVYASRSQSDLLRPFAREVTRQAVALQRLIVDLREMGSTDLHQIKRVQRPLRVETLIWSVANGWRQVAQAAGLTLHVIIEEKGLFVLGDEKRLRWALGNVVDNAIKYTLPGGALTVEIQASSEGFANLRVRDNGVGIARSERQYIFTRFYRGTPTTPEGNLIRVPGMGQGLFTAKQIFEAHGGKISVKSSVGKGTAAYMALPLTSETPLSLNYMIDADMDGETVRLSEDVMAELD